MLDLSPETEALATSLAVAQRRSVDLTIREALQVRQGQILAQRSIVSDALRQERLRDIAKAVAAIAALPELDGRSIKEITDELNPL